MKKHLNNQSFEAGDEVWKVARLFKLSEDLEPFDIPLKHLNIYNLQPTINTLTSFVGNIQRTLDADLSYPIILDDEGYVMDGRHRIARAMLENKESIKAVRFDENPTCCYVKNNE